MYDEMPPMFVLVLSIEFFVILDAVKGTVRCWTTDGCEFFREIFQVALDFYFASFYGGQRRVVGLLNVLPVEICVAFLVRSHFRRFGGGFRQCPTCGRWRDVSEERCWFSHTRRQPSDGSMVSRGGPCPKKRRREQPLDTYVSLKATTRRKYGCFTELGMSAGTFVAWLPCYPSNEALGGHVSCNCLIQLDSYSEMSPR